MPEKKSGFTSEKEIAGGIVEMNRGFREGKSVLDGDMLQYMRRLPRPIVVDFNNVLANNTLPVRHNPEAVDHLNVLREVGNVVIVTSAWDWDAVEKILRKGRMWHKDMTLVTADNWGRQKETPDNIKTINSFIDFIGKSEDLGYRDFLNGYKRVAHLFYKSFLVPILDNDPKVVENNPGMLGICIKAWEPGASADLRQELDIGDAPRFSLEEAVIKVREHYASLNL